MAYDHQADSKKVEWQQNLFLLGLVGFIVCIIFTLSQLAEKSTSPRVTESAQQHLERQHPRLQNLYKVTQGLFVEDLPPLEHLKLNYIHHKYFEIEFSIASEQLAKSRFDTHILPRFLTQEWHITEQSPEKIVLDHAKYGRCTLVYPQGTTAWQIRFYLGYFDNTPTSKIQPTPFTDPTGTSS